MLVKAYIKRHMFHLPMKETELLNQVETVLKKEVNKSSIGKIYPVTKIEDSENILIEKQNTNVFLLNLFLLVLSRNEKKITAPEYYNDSLIIKKLEEETQLNLSVLPFEGVEKEVRNYLNPVLDKPQVAPNEDETKETSFLENVHFNIDWLKGAQKELKRRE